MSIAIIDGEEALVCDECKCEGEHEVDAEYKCNDCEDDLCFPHMKEWPQPKQIIAAPIYCCAHCYKYRWDVMFK